MTEEKQKRDGEAAECTADEYERLLIEKERLMDALRMVLKFSNGKFSPRLRKIAERTLREIEEDGI